MRTDGRGRRSGLSVGRLVRMVVQVLVIAAVIGAVVGYAVVPGWSASVNSIFSSIRQVIAPNLVQQYSAGQATGPAAKGHPAQAAFDGNTSTYWAAPATGGVAPAIDAHFSPGTDVSKILVTSGALSDFQANRRPHDVSVQLLDSAGAVVAAKNLELKDVKDPQTFDVSAKAVTTVRLTVTSFYESSGGTNVAISEVEFFAAE